ncbi:hypothetical protein ZIOFF_008856 [Zingiber officinale]|uniref:DUF7806 domain-containing protein n=1 Tax=Zingiber officinale TaxID=94328 RepID=A0A8J5IH13_ZINOF|nr:hypothetical protein ZIOFF_008856 [Zingiber officinale]
MEPFDVKLYEKYKNLKKRKFTEEEEWNHTRDAELRSFQSAVEDLIEELNKENKGLHQQLDSFQEKYDECRMLLLEEGKKSKELSDEVEKLQNLLLKKKEMNNALLFSSPCTSSKVRSEEISKSPPGQRITESCGENGTQHKVLIVVTYNNKKTGTSMREYYKRNFSSLAKFHHKHEFIDDIDVDTEITFRQRGLEEQMTELFRTIQETRRQPVLTVNYPPSLECDPSNASEVRLQSPISGTLVSRYSKMKFPPILEKGIYWVGLKGRVRYDLEAIQKSLSYPLWVAYEQQSTGRASKSEADKLGLVEDLHIDIEQQKPENLGIAINMTQVLERKQCFHQAHGIFVTLSSLLYILIEDKGKQSDDRSNFIFQTLMRFLVGMDLYADNQTESPSILMVHKTSGYSFSLTWIQHEGDEGEWMYHVSSLGTLESIAWDWMKEDIIFSAVMCRDFFERVSLIIGRM